MKFYFRKIVICFIGLLNLIFPKRRNQILFHSFPDFSDSSFAVFKYLVESGSYKKYKIIWLYNRDYSNLYTIEEIKRLINTDCDIRLFPKKSLTGLLNFMTSKYIFFTHGIYSSIQIPKRQVVINLWHGIPIKNLGLLDDKNKEIASFSKLVSSTENMNALMSQIFGIKESRILNLGLPRTDLMHNSNFTLKQLTDDKGNYEKLLFWLPTYRKSGIGDIRNDGDVKESGLPFFTNRLLEQFNTILKSYNFKLLIKLHPMDSDTDIDKYSFSNIVFINDKLLFEKKIHLYSILGKIDVLLTDYSSIFIDYLQLDRPIGFVIDDIESYKNNRGFLFDNINEYIPGASIMNYHELCNFISEVKNSIDYYSDDRKRVNTFFNKHNDGKSTERLINYLNL